MTPYNPHARHLVEPCWLKEHISDDQFRLIDTRFSVRGRAQGGFEQVSGRDAYLKGHIPGAQFVDLNSDLTDLKNPTQIIGPAAFTALMNKLGIGQNSRVVLYDDQGGIWAARLWWALRFYGHEDVRILNGGLTGWLAADGGLQSDVITPPLAQFVVNVRPQLYATKEDVLEAIEDPVTRIVDALPAPFYDGQVGLYPRHRKGHIPTAQNLDAQFNLDPQTLRLKPIETLRQIWRGVEIEPDQKVITYCGSGVFGSFALFVLSLLGHERAALYDASWMEWGCDEDLSVITT